MLLAKEMGAQNLLVKSDSQLITGQVSGEFQAKDPQMAAYLKYVQLLKGAFNALELIHVPREQNARADLLAKLASSGKGGRQRTVIQETLKAPWGCARRGADAGMRFDLGRHLDDALQAIPGGWGSPGGA